MVAVVGGHSAAADFANQGFDDHWYVCFPDNHEAVLETEEETLRTSECIRGRDALWESDTASQLAL